MHGLADGDGALVGLLLPGDHAEQRGLAGAVRTDHADDAAGRQLEGEIVDQLPVAETLAEVLEVDHVGAQTFGDGDDDLRGRRRLLARLLQQFLIPLVARLGLGLAGLGRRGNPFLLAGKRLLVRGILAAFLLQPLLLLHQPLRVIALIRNAAAAIELEDPAGERLLRRNRAGGGNGEGCRDRARGSSR
ncbi:hypothetical protein ES703_113796 [subsurface metagenome]